MPTTSVQTPKTRGSKSPAKSARAPTDHGYAARAHRYAREVVAGNIIACKWTRLACGRHLNDLAKEDYPYTFDIRRAELPCRFLELLPHTKGKWARPLPGQRNTIHLEDWQCFLLCSIFGWIDRATGLRRFSDVFLLVARKNAKSTLAAGIGLYMMVADGEYGAEVYSGATTEKQAWEVFRPARLMAKKTPELQQDFGIEIAAKSLFVEDDGSRFEPIVGQPGDGASPSCAITDEYHEHPTAAQYDAMKTGMAAREQPISLVISTAGSDTAGPCYDKQLHVQKVLEGLLEDESTFGIIYCADEDDDWTSESAQRKANPNYGVSVFPAFLAKQLREAQQQASKQNNYKTKHLNLWVGAAVAWMNMEKWRAAADPALALEDFAGQDYYEASDLSSKIDITARVKCFVRDIPAEVVQDDGKKRTVLRRHYYVFGHYYLPMDTAMDEDNQHYQRWVHEKLLTATPGAEIDYQVVKQDIEADMERFNVRCLGFDPWGAVQLQAELSRELPEDIVITIPQQTKFLTDPMKEVEAAVLSGRLHHNGDPVLAWMISNVVARTDAGDRVFPTKERKQNKIDGAVALIMAVSRAMLATPAKKSVYATRGLRTA